MSSKCHRDTAVCKLISTCLPRDTKRKWTDTSTICNKVRDHKSLLPPPCLSSDRLASAIFFFSVSFKVKIEREREKQMLDAVLSLVCPRDGHSGSWHPKGSVKTYLLCSQDNF